MCREPVVMGRKMGLRKAILEITLPDYPVEVVPLPGSPLKSSVAYNVPPQILSDSFGGVSFRHWYF